MGDIFQYEWVRSLAPALQGPVLEIGSRRCGGPPVFYDYRTVFSPGTSYLGVDLEPGEGVDLVLDMASSYGEIAGALSGREFNTILCMSVLEHVPDIFGFARNLCEILKEGGIAILSVPVTWQIHAHPGDYWRLTPSAMKYLFPMLRFEETKSWLHTLSGRKMRLDSGGDMNEFMFPGGMRRDEYGGSAWILENTMCDMVGVKRSNPGAAGDYPG